MICLGINYSQMKDASACVAVDGQVVHAVAEERLSRMKHDGRFPSMAIESCLSHASIRANDVTHLCFGWSPVRRAFRQDITDFLTLNRTPNYVNVASSVRYLISMTRQQGGARLFQDHFGVACPNVRFIDHHLAHAISTYAYSGFADAAILVIDGRGAWEATSIWHGREGRIEHVQTIPWPNSLGFFYAQFTHYLGFEPYSDEWKVMGLAPYGRPGVDLSRFITVGEDGYRVATRLLFGKDSAPSAAIEAHLGPKRVPESEITDHHKNIAFAVQDQCERAMLKLAAGAVAKTGCRNLCLAGGVALNSKANGKILASGIVDNLFIQPAAGDDGVCLGAALAPHLDSGGKLPMRRMRHAYLGPASSDAEIEKALVTFKIRHTRVSDPAKAAAELLASGKMLGWFQGRMEFGPRALGSRSILADPRDPHMTAKVNNAVKFREWWRPFAPSMLAGAAADFIESATDSPFMILTAQVRPEKRAVIPAVTHVDGSARPQTVERDVNPLYWKLICEFGGITGIPVVMNTSFNLRGEPIVCTPTDAIRTFFSSGMDALVIGSFLVVK